ncbi:MFS transporter [Vulcanisaeta distributa]|uniref:General substrate transporter n=1 Tax=Vulcanisaeta distributa (strain DSM 14429 / JCM 11212 / NBRC 100878 / IC-017) TaxID=572478 RepID=E1QU11_VULDI|nr:MFS transporter [Vulcanisaeta distributa]ADN49808.1 General substrate transporter [Vulcanisaeta distributa DSM 14429]
MSGPTVPEHVRRRGLMLASISTFLAWALEYYDFLIYFSLIPYISELFFPKSNPLAALIYTLLVFAVGYFARPLGAIFFGHIGDKYGRRNALLGDAITMAAATVVIALLPTYSQIGIWAPTLLTIFRFVQGFGYGGEAGGGVVWALEFASPKWRGLVNGVLNSSMSVASLLATGLLLLVSAYYPIGVVGWRILFLSGAVVVIIGLIIRFAAPESILWERKREEGRIVKIPLATAIRRYWFSLILVILINLGLTFVFYAGYGFVTTFTKLLSSYMPELQRAFIKLTYLPLMLGSIGGIIGNTFGGYLTDLFGRRRMLIIPTAILLITIYPLYLALTTLSIPIMALSLALMYFIFTLSATVQTAYFSEIFPTEVRWSGIGFGWNLNAAIGSLAPTFALLLYTSLKGGMNPITAAALAPSIVVMIGAAMTIIGASIGPETVRKQLE